MSTTSTTKQKLTAAQKKMYSGEKLMNFRWISKLLARRSSRILTAADVATLELHQELADIGQYAEIASSRGSTPIRELFKHIDVLLKTGFPLEGYSALGGANLIDEYFGSVAHLRGFTAYRPDKKQLVLSFSGTTTLTQAMFDIRTHKHMISSGHGGAHSGFWKIYKGIKRPAEDSIRVALEKYDIEEIVVTGHSLGAAISYLFMLNLLSGVIPFSPTLRLTVVAFGSPRPGDSKLAAYWLERVQAFKIKHGESSFNEYSLKAYNDGVTSLPPRMLGFRHFCRSPLYYHNGRLYHIPEEFYEDSLFAGDDDSEPSDFPKGGHNYYSGRDMEKMIWQIQWLDKVMSGEDLDWEERFLKYKSRRRRYSE